MTSQHSDTGDRPHRPAPIRVLVADDHPLTRLGIRHALGDGFEVCAEAGDADGAVAAALREQPDICLLDVGMPGNGIAAAARIAAQVPGAAVVMITAAWDPDTILAALRAGAVGYLPKENAFTRLPQALLGVLSGEAAVPRDAVLRLLGELRRRRHVRLPDASRAGMSLTGREADVLQLLLEGFSTIEISQKLFLAPPTVRTHVAALMRKFAVRDRDALRALFDGVTSASEGSPQRTCRPLR
jgi:DNA-binding NarL/FixJ family response regulator